MVDEEDTEQGGESVREEADRGAARAVAEESEEEDSVKGWQ
jgi:hypothetical protein